MAPKPTQRISTFEDNPLSSLWFKPQGANSKALLLGHGAGGHKGHPFFLFLGEQLSKSGTLVVAFNFPYREAGRKAPDPQKRLEASYQFMVEQVRLETDRLFIGGRSMGGRIASHIATLDPSLAGLILLAYPLHPVGKPEKLRVAHLSKIRCPTLFVQGTRDPFSTPRLLNLALKTLKRPYRLKHIEGGDHSFKTRKSSGRTPQEVDDEVLETILEFMA